MRRLRRALVALGSATVLGAVAWWWITYGEVIGCRRFALARGRREFGQNSDICSFAKALCFSSHLRVLLAYWASVFWLGVIVLSASLLASERAKAAQ